MYQSLTIVGNLGRDPEMRFTPGGTPVTKLSVATNRKYTGADGQLVKETTWFNVSIFGKQAEACAQYLKKGSKVLVEGRLQGDKSTGGPRVWEKDGRHGASFDVQANSVTFMDSKSDATGDAPVGEEETASSGSSDL